MTTQSETGGLTLEDVVAGNIRAEVARAGLSQADISRALHVPRSWVSTRYRGVARWTIGDVERVADLLGLPPSRLFVLPRLDSNQQPAGYRSTRHLSPVAYAHDRDLLTVQGLLGHASPATTQRYVRPPGEAARRTVLAVAAAA